MNAHALGSFWKRGPMLIAALGLLASAAGSVARADEPAKPAAVTTADPAIPIEDLRTELRPLTKAELEVEAAAWLDLLRAKVSEISRSELDVRRRNRAMSAAKQDAASQPSSAPAATAEAEAHAKAKEATLEALNTLRDERVAITDRLVVVLDALEARGGAAADQRKYIAAVTDLAPVVDVSDVSASWIAVRGWLTSKEGGLRWGRNVVLFIVTLIVARIAANIIAAILGRTLRQVSNLSELLRTFFVNVTRQLIFIVGLVVALAMLEVNVGPMVAAIGAVGFIVGFALQGTLSNFAAGIMILVYRPYDLGDEIAVGAVKGRVESMSLVTTTVRNAEGQLVIAPNGVIWGGVITNLGKPDKAAAKS